MNSHLNETQGLIIKSRSILVGIQNYIKTSMFADKAQIIQILNDQEFWNLVWVRTSLNRNNSYQDLFEHAKVWPLK